MTLSHLPSQASRVSRSMAVGLTLGFFSGAAYLTGAGLATRRSADCTSLSDPECRMQQELTGARRRLQLEGGAASGLLGLALALTLRKKRTASRSQGDA